MAAFVVDRGVVLAGAGGSGSGRSAMPALPEAIAGRALAGSWWSQPETGRIYDLLELAEHDGLAGAPVCEAPLVEAKRAVLAPHLAPLAARLALDPGRLERAEAVRSPAAGRLLEAVSSLGSLRMDDPRAMGAGGSAAALRKARLELERALVVTTSTFHTDAGRHVALLEPFGRSAIAELTGRGDPATGGYDDVLAAFTAALLGSAVVARVAEMAKWCTFEPDRGRRALAVEGSGGRPVATDAGKWLATPNLELTGRD